MSVLLSKRKSTKVCIGIDANTSMAAMTDYLHVGDAVAPDETSILFSDRALHFHDTLASHNLYLTNTFTEDTGEELQTRTDWLEEGSSQVDFIAASMNLKCLDSGVTRSLAFRTDHNLVWASFDISPEKRPNRDRHYSCRWSPAESWEENARIHSWDFQDWGVALGQWRTLMKQHAVHHPRKPKDAVCI